MMIANLIEKEWLRRNFNVVTADGVFEVAYDGRGMGYEQVKVNDEVACRKPSYIWYVDKFDFMIGRSKAQVRVKVSLLLQISKFSLLVDDTIIYSE